MTQTDWFDEAGFAELSFDAPDGVRWSVGADRLTGEPVPLVAGTRMFTFER